MSAGSDRDVSSEAQSSSRNVALAFIGTARIPAWSADKLSAITTTPTPNPSPQGGGEHTEYAANTHSNRRAPHRVSEKSRRR